MANLTEQEIYSPNIFRIEDDTPADGGEPGFNAGEPVTGHANAQAQQLANRTAFLKAENDALKAEVKILREQIYGVNG